jgi:hypothetical protein
MLSIREGAGSTAPGASAESGQVADPSVAAAPPPPAFLLEMQTGVRAQCTRFNADGTLIATGCEDGSVKVHNTATGQASYYFDPKHYSRVGTFRNVILHEDSVSTLLLTLADSLKIPIDHSQCGSV